MKPESFVSVILPTHNRRELLPRALESVLCQSFQDLEVIVIDDGSTDGTCEYLSTVCDPRVRYVRCELNRGQSTARNLGIGMATGAMIAFQDSDDEWLPEKLARQVDVLNRRPAIDMVYGDLLRIPRRGEPFVLRAPDLVRGRIMDRRNSGYASYGIGIQTCLIRAEVLGNVGGFNERMFCFEDLELFLRLNRRHASIRICDPLVRYHETDGVSRATTHEVESRKHLLRRFWWPILRQRPSWFTIERDNIRHHRRLDE